MESKEEIEALYKEYFEAFGEFPMVSPDCDFYSTKRINEIKAALATLKKE